MDTLTITLILLSVGLLLLILELFVPSGGLLGIGAAICILAGIIVAFLGGIKQGAIVLTTCAVLMPVLLYSMLRFWPHTAIGRRILIQPASEDERAAIDSPQRMLKDLIGRVGVAKSPMLPSGLIVIDGVSHDSVSDGVSIEVGREVEVIDVRTNRLIVRPFQKKTNLPPNSSNSPLVKADDVLAHPIEEFGLDALDDPLG